MSAQPHAVGTATPACPHFGPCGGCQHQDLTTEAQLALKLKTLRSLLHEAGITTPDNIPTHAAEPYHYRNRIRLRIETIDVHLRLGYNERATTTFLPITTCPIAAPALWSIAESLLRAAAHDRDAAFWLNAATEIELFCNQPADNAPTQLQLTLLCAPRTKSPQGSFQRAFNAMLQHVPTGITLAGAGAIAADPRTGPTGRTLAEAGATGLNYTLGSETYWITRGAFFQVNRFLVPTLVDLVTANQSGQLAWDLFAGVGLFSRILARTFTRVTAVEANPLAVADLRNAFRKLAGSHTAIESTTLDFLKHAITQRDRPGLVVLDPPRAGAGTEACELLARIAPPAIVYVSCDPTTLARDLAILQPHYTLAALHLVDLFPQTSHLESVAILTRTS